MAVFAAYANSLSVPFVLDDQPTIVDNPTIRAVRTAWLPPVNSATTSSGRPLFNLTLALNYASGRTNVLGYHVVNLCLHAAAALVFAGLVRRTLVLPRAAHIRAWIKYPNAFAWATTAVWALHPLLTAAVTYASQRAEVLVSLCYLSVLYAFARSLAGGSRWRWIAVLVCYAGMAAKEVMVSAPLLVLVYDRAFGAGTFRTALRERRGFYLALAGSWAFLALLMGLAGGRGGTAGFGLAISPLAYACTQCEAIVHYLRLVFWPQNLVFDYGNWPQTTGPSDILPQALLILVLLGATGWALVRRPALGCVTLAFFAILAPTSSFVPVRDPIFEHRMFLPSAVVLLLASAWLFHALGRSAAWLLAVVATGLVGLTVARNADYASARSLWTDTVAKAPHNVRAWYSLGIAETLAGDYPAATQSLERARQLDADNPEVAVALANVLAQGADKTRAIELYRWAVARLSPATPVLYEACHNLGVMLRGAGDDAGAIEYLSRAAQLRPESAEAELSLANALASSGRLDAAVPHFERAAALAPENALAPLSNLGKTYLALNRPADAAKVYAQAVALAPQRPELRYAFANALLQANQLAEAAVQYEAVVQASPDFPEAHNELGIAYAQLGRPQEAQVQFETALRLRPNFPGVRENLQRLRESQ